MVPSSPGKYSVMADCIAATAVFHWKTYRAERGHHIQEGVKRQQHAGGNRKSEHVDFGFPHGARYCTVRRKEPGPSHAFLNMRAQELEKWLVANLPRFKVWGRRASFVRNKTSRQPAGLLARPGNRQNLAELRRRNGLRAHRRRGRTGERRRVGDTVGVAAQFEVLLLGDVELLAQREVQLA